jgi:hypothetical protein
VVVADILLRKKADKSIPVKVKIAGCGFWLNEPLVGISH